MDIANYSKARKQTIKRVKELALKHLGTVPQELDDEQMQILDSVIGNAIGALKAAKESGTPLAPAHQETINILGGEKKIVRARTALESVLVRSVVEVKQQIDTTAEFIESYAPHRLTQAYARAALNVNAIRNEFEITPDMSKATFSQEQADDLDLELELLQAELGLKQ